MMQIRLFAGARQAVGRESLSITLPDMATVVDLRRALADQCPALSSWQPHLLIAVNQEYAADDHPLAANDEVACFPPVSGG